MPRFAAFYDFHTPPSVHDVGQHFDAEATADRLAACGVDFTAIAARCNQGFCYYDSKLGIRHPSLDFDLFGRFVDACRARGIAVSAYLNVGLSHEEGLRHRDWLAVTPEGEIYTTPRDRHEFRTMCYNSPYGDHVLAMIDELLAYPVDGFFLDCLTPHVCIGAECSEERRRLGLDRDAFARLSQLRMVRRIGEKLQAADRDFLVFFNCVRFIDQLPWATYLEFECLPTGGWGYESLPAGARHVRTLGKPVLNMTGRFHESWGDFGGLRPRASVLADCVAGLANGLAPNIADHFHPRGDLNEPVYRLIGGIYRELADLAPWTDGAAAEADIALVVPPDAFDNSLASVPSIHAMQGWTRILCELRRQFDVLLPEQDFSRYRALVLADDVRFDEPLRRRVEAFLAAGGRVLASGRSGLSTTPAPAFPPAWGVEYLGDSPHDPGYFRVTPEGRAALGPLDVPDMPVAVHDAGVSMRAVGGAAMAEVVAPYGNRHVDDERSYLYTPPDAPDGTAALAAGDAVAHVAFPVGLTYYRHAQPHVRNLAGAALAKLLPRPMLAVAPFPSFGRATVTRQPGRRMAWLTAYVPERRGEKVDMVEEGIELRDLTLRLRLDEGGTVRRVYQAPDGRELPFILDRGYAETTLPALHGHAVVVFDTGP